MSTSGPDAPVAVGRIGRAHGLRGDVVVDLWTDDPDRRFAPGSVLHTAGPDLVVGSARTVGARFTVAFSGITDRSAAEALRGTVLSVPAGARPPIEDPDEFYDTDLEGLTVLDTAGADLGTVIEVVHGPGGDLLAVRLHADGPDDAGREHLIPFVAAMVPRVDLAAGSVTVDPPDGLFEL